MKLRGQEIDKLSEMITKKDKTINKDFFTKYFQFQSVSAVEKSLSKAHSTQVNNKLVQVIKSGLVDLNRRVKNMSDDEKKIEKPNEIVDAAVEVLDFNKQNQQKAEGLKILTPEQMLSRLRISLAQLKTGIILKNLKMK